MKLRICGLANIVGSAAFILVGSFSAVASDRSDPRSISDRASAETPVERGSYLVNSIGQCANCHGRDAQGSYHPGRALAGGFTFDIVDPTVPGHVIAPNITPDPETGIGKWSKADIVVALRNGKRPDGSIIGPPMPIDMYRHMSDGDANAIATYLLSQPPIKNSVQNSQYKIKLTEYGPPVTHVDAPSRQDKVAYGSYLATMGHCVLCHTPPGDGQPFNMKLAFAGGRDFGPVAQTGPSVSRNITSDPDQGLGRWTDYDIKQAITMGIQPNGSKLTGPMPYDMFAKMTPPDLDAIVAFIRTIKPIKSQDTTQAR
jgi:mono/diheme cytochrome c family protein